MATKRQRVFALFGAILFFLSTVAVSGFVVWQMVQDGKQTNSGQNDAATQEALKKLQEQQQNNPNALKGKKMDNFTPMASVPELQKIDLKTGDGAEVQPNSTVTVHYTGALAKDGTIFESSKDSGQPATFALDQVIPGWTQGLPGMKIGGVRRLVIPAQMAYGDRSPSPSIPANSDLVFDIELVKVQ
jgi:FKBP-type peptidyl-prolyl cis-trans isomerase